MGADGIIGQRIHLEAIGAGDISCLFARARSTRRTRRHFVRRDTGDELVDRTRRCIDIDRRRHAKHAQVGDIVGEHLGRGVGHRRAAQRGIALGKRRLAAGAGHRRGGLERQRRAKVNQAQVEGAFGKLSVERQARRAHHYISGRDITMDEPLAYQAHAAEQIEQVATQARRHERRQTPGIIYGKARAQAGERLALDPLHDNRGHAVDLAPPVQAGKALKARKGTMAFIFLAKRRLELGDQRLVGDIVIKFVARWQDELLERHGLALRVNGTRHTADTAAAHGGVIGKQHRKTAQVGGKLVRAQGDGRLKPVDARQAQAHHGITVERLGYRRSEAVRHRAIAATLVLKLLSATSSLP